MESNETKESDLYPLHRACAKGDIVRVKQLLSQGHFVNETNFDLVQPLHEACFNGHIEIVRLLISAGADVNGRNIDGATPLCDACSSGNEECVQILLESGANVNPQLLLSSPLHEAVLRDKWRCALQLITAGASLNQSDCHFGTPLHASVYKGSVNCVKVLLKSGCDVDSVKILRTPLHYAARQQDLTLVMLLLQFGADPCKTDNDDHIPRDLIPSATSPVRQLLLEWESCDVDSVKILRTPLHYAARQQDLTLVKLLLHFGADPCKTDNDDHIPRDLIPSATSPVRQLLLEWERNPKQLKFHCRKIIRQTVGRNRLGNIHELKLPKLLHNYVTYADIEVL